jgi:ribonuclease Y
MSLKIVILLCAGAAFFGIIIGYFLRWLVALGKKGSMELEIKQKLFEAREEANEIVDEAKDEGKKLILSAEKEAKNKENDLRKTEDRLIKKEDLLDKRQSDIDQETEKLKILTEETEQTKQKGEEIFKEKQKELERISSLSSEEAREKLLNMAEKQYSEDILVRIHKLELDGEERLEKKAREILTSIVHRLGNSMPTDVMSTTINIPSDDIKGKIIGKEGRNIKAFERATGVEVIVDDTPGSIMISCFDPVRRQVARLALENLMIDGRIQPARIEEEAEKARNEINRIIKEKGEQAVYECGVYNLDPRIVSILGRLYFRTSYGQNVLQHSVEVSHLAGMLAEQLGADVQVAKAGALLHDIGKAVDHEIQGTHVEIGRRILQKFGADENIVKAMQAHHEEYPYETPESIIVQVADAISGSRPGARRDTVENYLKRLEELEGIANSFSGVEKSYALQAGREIRVFVTPQEIDDLEARKVAREIAMKIEKELKYPGEIKVTLIRENRVIEYAR